MKKNLLHIIQIGILFQMVLFSTQKASAEDLTRIISLTGSWKFSVGDNSNWSDPGFNDSNWDVINVPGKWEDNGYSEYNGYAWYRKKFTLQTISDNTPVYLVFGRIDDADEVYLNGRKIGMSGNFPPDFISAYNERRKYNIPREYINFNGTNTLAVRVYDSYLEGGIINGPVGIYIDEDYNFLDLDLSGQWKFHLGDNKQWKSPSFDDGLWPKINVPSEWEHEGYVNYDGYAWYRTKFRVPSDLKNQTLYLVLGKIDDYDYVYLNDKLIGNVFELDKDGEYRRKGYEYNARRIYKIPTEALNQNGDNTIAIRVFDGRIRGGIYEGPIGLMTESNCRQYRRKHYENQSFWDFIVEEFLIDKR